MELWTVSRMLDWMQGYLADRGDSSPQNSARWIVSDALNMSKTDLFLNLDRPLNSDELDILRQNVSRRAKGEPLQYITGKTYFRHIEVLVEPGVLIPRPETEVLVSEALALLPEYRYNESDRDVVAKPSVHIAEIGVGTGCIACSLAYENPFVEVYASDISPEAIRISNRNVENLNLHDRVHIFEGNLGEPLSSAIEQPFDMVVSNPPYIPTCVLEEIPDEVKNFEPALALDGGEDGLEVFRRIADWSVGSLKSEGHLICELHETCLDAACDYAQSIGFVSTRIVRDLADKPRVIIASGLCG